MSGKQLKYFKHVIRITSYFLKNIVLQNIIIRGKARNVLPPFEKRKNILTKMYFKKIDLINMYSQCKITKDV